MLSLLEVRRAPSLLALNSKIWRLELRAANLKRSSLLDLYRIAADDPWVLHDLLRAVCLQIFEHIFLVLLWIHVVLRSSNIFSDLLWLSFDAMSRFRLRQVKIREDDGGCFDGWSDFSWLPNFINLNSVEFWCSSEFLEVLGIGVWNLLLPFLGEYRIHRGDRYLRLIAENRILRALGLRHRILSLFPPIPLKCECLRLVVCFLPAHCVLKLRRIEKRPSLKWVSMLRALRCLTRILERRAWIVVVRLMIILVLDNTHLNLLPLTKLSALSQVPWVMGIVGTMVELSVYHLQAKKCVVDWNHLTMQLSTFEVVRRYWLWFHSILRIKGCLHRAGLLSSDCLGAVAQGGWEVLTLILGLAIVTGIWTLVDMLGNRIPPIDLHILRSTLIELEITELGGYRWPLLNLRRHWNITGSANRALSGLCSLDAPTELNNFLEANLAFRFCLDVAEATKDMEIIWEVELLVLVLLANR